VEAGQTLVVLEAMKMEHRVQAPRAGTVASVDVAVDDQVDGGKQLCALEEA
jgi:biotin carboxyl carrier protein